jgi:hypothetical protein
LQLRVSQLNQTAFRLRYIYYVEVGSFLLKSWVNVRGVSSQGLLTTTLKFNTVSERLFGPILNKVWTDAPQPAAIDPHVERARLREIEGLSLKLLNFGKNSILPAETVSQALWQPEIQPEILTLFAKWISRTISTVHLSILMDRELIVVRENPSRDSKYGVIRTYVPLGSIGSVSLDRKRDDSLTATLHFPENDRLELLYSPSNGAEVEGFLEELGSAVAEAVACRGSRHGS